MAAAYQEIVKQVLNQFGKVSNTEERDKEGFIKYILWQPLPFPKDECIRK